MVPKHFRAVTLIKVAIMSYYPYFSQWSLIIQNNILVQRYPPKISYYPV